MAITTTMKAGSVLIQCPACDIAVNIPVTCEVLNDELAHQGKASLVCTPDMADLWAHMWSHDER